MRTPTCHLRELPAGVLPNVGFPTPADCAKSKMSDCIVVTKTDYAQMIAFVSALRDWALDAKACIEAR